MSRLAAARQSLVDLSARMPFTLTSLQMARASRTPIGRKRSRSGHFASGSWQESDADVVTQGGTVCPEQNRSLCFGTARWSAADAEVFGSIGFAERHTVPPCVNTDCVNGKRVRLKADTTSVLQRKADLLRSAFVETGALGACVWRVSGRTPIPSASDRAGRRAGFARAAPGRTGSPRSAA